MESPERDKGFEVPAKKISLDNGLELTFYDKSFILASDRWHVVMIARIEVPVARFTDKENTMFSARDIEEALGETVVFEKREEIVFVDKKDKENIFRELVEGYAKTTLPYLSREDFPRRFLNLRYAEHLKKQRLDALRERHQNSRI